MSFCFWSFVDQIKQKSSRRLIEFFSITSCFFFWFLITFLIGSFSLVVRHWVYSLIIILLLKLFLLMYCTLILKLIWQFGMLHFLQDLCVYLLYMNGEIWPVDAIKHCAHEACQCSRHSSDKWSFDFSLLGSLKPLCVSFPYYTEWQEKQASVQCSAM